MVFVFGKMFLQDFRQHIKQQLAIIVAQARYKGLHYLIVAEFLQAAYKRSLVLGTRSAEAQHTGIFFNKAVGMSSHGLKLFSSYCLQAIQKYSDAKRAKSGGMRRTFCTLM